jgi:hypothetical protein
MPDAMVYENGAIDCSNRQKRFVWIIPIGDGSCTCTVGAREGLEFAEGVAVPVSGAQDDEDDAAGGALLVAIKCRGHFFSVAVFLRYLYFNCHYLFPSASLYRMKVKGYSQGNVGSNQ